AAPAGPPRPAPVIRRVGGAGESDRLLTRTLPAWVVSGLLNFGLIALAWLVFGWQPAPAKSSQKVITAAVEKDPADSTPDLTNEDLGLDSALMAALPEIERLADQTSVGLVTDDPVGVPDAATNDANTAALPGLPAAEMTGGAEGLTGDVLAGAGGANGNASAQFLGRSGGTKSKLLREGGGNDLSEAAVARGLAWLAAQQKKDGYWEFDPPGKGEDVKIHKLDRTTATGLALLPFLAAGVTHKTPGHKYARKVDAGLRFLVDNLDATGRFKSPSPQYMYGHGIATMALCEAYGMTRDKSLREPAQRAVNFLSQTQGPDGSWGYQPRTTGDTSIVGWQLQALRAAELGKDLVVKKDTVARALRFLDSVASGSRKAVYGYSTKNGQPGTALTAVGLLCRYYMDGWGPGSPGMAEGVPGLFGTPRPGAGPGEPRTNRERAPKTLAQAKANKTVPDMYYFYYATQVVHFFEGPEWREWNEGPKDKDGRPQGGMRDWLVEVQQKAGRDSGSWDPDPGSIGANCGRVGTTCLCLLTLEVYYRHLPLYKRDGGQVLDQVK
ncbi:MAG: terpene cyclase/mutase family protein, partial [Gemmataceae bacterium]|nr:terpene cyclase/mutase family protein [Gemmataceae bacterium]